MLWNKVRYISLYSLDSVLKGIILLEDLSEYRIVNKLGNTDRLRILKLRNPASDVNHHRRKNLDISCLCLNP